MQVKEWIQENHGPMVAEPIIHYIARPRLECQLRHPRSMRGITMEQAREAFDVYSYDGSDATSRWKSSEPSAIFGS